MEQSIIYVGLDVHKDTIAVALAEAGLRGEVRTVIGEGLGTYDVEITSLQSVGQ